MRKVYVSVVVIGLVAVALLAGALLPAASQVPGERTEIQLFDPNKQGSFEKFIDLGQQGDSPGDFGVFKDLQLDPETCEDAGTALGRFNLVKFVGRRDGYFIADFGLLLADGKISLSAAGRFSEFEEGARFSVTGGTDAYKDVRGEATLQEGQTMCDQKGALITLDLLLQ